MSFTEDLHDTFLFFLWDILPKKYELIHGTKISYLRLSPFIMGKNVRGGPGMILYDRSTGKCKIFTTGNDPFLRYTVCHEYWECEARRNIKNADERMKLVIDKFHLIAEVYEQPPKIPPADDAVFSMELRNWIERNGAHVLALIKEIELAKEELPQDKLELFFNDIRKNDRFVLNIKKIGR